MAKLITTFWRDIPSHVVARRGRETVCKVKLPERFEQAIDRAAMRAGKGSSDAYIEEWRQVSTEVQGDLEAAAQSAADALEAAFDEQRLERVVKAGGVSVD